jgi:hypothetical protein
MHGYLINEEKSMKKGIKVTEGNIATVADRIRKALKRARTVRDTNAYVSTRSRALALFASHRSTYDSVWDGKRLLLSVSHESPAVVEIDRSFSFTDRFIAIGGARNRTIIRIGDEVDVTAQGVLVRKQNPTHMSYSPQPKCFKLITPA